MWSLEKCEKCRITDQMILTPIMEEMLEFIVKGTMTGYLENIKGVCSVSFEDPTCKAPVDEIQFHRDQTSR